MIALANLLNAIAQLLSGLIWFAYILIIARVVVSWVNADMYNPIVRFITSSTDPLLNPISRKFPLQYGAMDFTPIAVLLFLSFLEVFLVQTIMDYAVKIRLESLATTFDLLQSVALTAIV
jgi:YggT family protein